MTGDVLWREITEQPDVLGRQIEARAEADSIARSLHRRGCDQIRFVGHGSSDNATTYGVYAIALLAGLPAVRDSVTLPVVYHAAAPPPRVAVAAVSQSGRTPDIVEYVRAARTAGAPTVAITGARHSPLAAEAEYLLELHVGVQRAAAATKSYTASLAAVALLAGALGGLLDDVAHGLDLLAASMPTAIESQYRAAPRIAALLAEYDRVFVTGRGLHFATAREIALKLTETTGSLACAHTAADLIHGPIAALGRRPFPVWAIGGQDSGDIAVQAALSCARSAAAPTILTAPVGACLDADYRLPTAAAPSPLLGPFLGVVSGQVVAHATARLRGIDPDRPVPLSTKPSAA